MKKLGALFFLLAFMPLASAAPIDDIARGLESFVSGIEPLARLLLGDAGTGDLLFAKVLFFVIIMTIVWVVLDRVEFFNEHDWVTWTLAVVVAILSTRYLSDTSYIQAMILPYSVLGIAISAGLPFLLYFFVVEVGLRDQIRLVRRIAWILFACVFVGLWFSRYDELAKAVWIYPITAIVAILMAFMDGTIQRIFLKMHIERAGVANKQELIDHYLRKKHQARQDHQNNIIDMNEMNRRIKDYDKQIAKLHK